MTVLDYVVIGLYALFATGLPLPQIGGVTLVSPAVIYNSGYVTVACNFTFVPPANVARS